MDTLKLRVHAAFVKLQRDKEQQLQQALTDLFESGKNETKSTAGDKHETALAHLQIEQQKTRQQLYEVQEQTAFLKTIDATLPPSLVVRKGSLVQTNRQVFLLPAGLVKLN